ncbi:N-6 DNA methylase [Amycolatopsis sp. NPDC059021]|uniref:type I restriction-modification system subunit M/S n=1 Tax=Amycolatopsis sp. NPDC059021 TaxID=3346704 RepID=UPI00366C1407
MSVENRAERLVSRNEIAQLAGVQRPAVSNWERRHADFPRPHPSSGTDYFRLAQLLTWLESRPIRASELTSGEVTGTTYADRVRRNLDDAATRRSSAIMKPEHSRLGSSVDRLLGPLAERVCGSAPMTDYLNLVHSLVLLHAHAPDRWEQQLRAAAAVSSAEDATALLRKIGTLADDELRRFGVLPGMSQSTARLRPQRSEDLVSVVRLSGGLNGNDIRSLLERYETHAGLRGSESFTPGSVTRLMAQAITMGSSAGQRVYDPYARGGELLTAAVEALDDHYGGASGASVCGESPDQTMLRIMGMNLALHGIPGEVKASTTAPWEDGSRTPRKANLILSNPPFNASASIRQGMNEDAWHFGAPPPGNDNFAWLQHILASLEVDGRAAVVMPNNAAASANQRERVIRQRLVDEGAVECVIGLPARMFATTTIPVSVWLLKYPTGSCDHVLFIDARQRGEKMGKQHVLSDLDQDEIAGALRSWRGQGGKYLGTTGFSVSVNGNEISARNYSLSPTDYVTRRVRPASPAGMSFAALTGAREREAKLSALARKADGEARRLDASIEREAQSSGWVTMPLSALCEIQSGPSPRRLSDKRISADGVVPVVAPKHLCERRIVAKEHRKVSLEVAEDLHRFKLAAGDIVSVRTGSTGPSALVEEPQAGWLMGTNLLRLHDFVTEKVDPLYLLSYLSLPDVVEWIQKRSKEATAIPSLSADTFGQLSVELPPLPEQQRIGAVLKGFDEQIAAYRAAVQAKVDLRAMAAAHLMVGGNRAE